MTTREDIDYDLRRSPRIATVASPSVEMLMQDYVDTTRPFESSFIAMSHPFVMSASGKEDLGGGKLVGITVNAEDMKLAFQARTTPAETGTITTGSGAPDIQNEQTLIDTAADFITAGVTSGSLVVNFTDQSIADVVEVVDLNTLVTHALENGIGNTYDVTDVYHVFNVIQCTSRGGNLVANDSNDVTFPAILPTAFTQIVQESDSSAVILNLASIEADITTIVAQTTASAIGVAVWDALISAHSVTGSFGEFIVRRLLTVAKFFALR